MAELITSAQLVGISVKEVQAGFGWRNDAGKFHFIYPLDDNMKETMIRLFYMPNLVG